ncbi:MAG: transporter substrate-binding domain-containing protein, partial [Alphaproteobacteria bacterium]|nr:transporter substrate-binding domain-containing protein [Alphaproteobacteria bacterium]
MARIIATTLHKKLVIEEMAFDSIIGAIQSGKADLGLSGISVTPDRLKNISFSIPYTKSKKVIIVRSDETGASSRQSLTERFNRDFIKDARWKYLATGLGHTLIITVLAVIIGVTVGGLIAVIRVSHDKNGSFSVLNFLCRLYLAVIRGTPVMIQLL